MMTLTLSNGFIIGVAIWIAILLVAFFIGIVIFLVIGRRNTVIHGHVLNSHQSADEESYQAVTSHKDRHSMAAQNAIMNPIYPESHSDTTALITASCDSRSWEKY